MSSQDQEPEVSEFADILDQEPDQEGEPYQKAQILAFLPGTVGDILPQERIVSLIMNSLPEEDREKFKALFATSLIGNSGLRIISKIPDSRIKVKPFDDGILVGFLHEILNGKQTFRHKSLKAVKATVDMYAQMRALVSRQVGFYSHMLYLNGFFEPAPNGEPRVLLVSTGSYPCILPIIPLLRRLGVTVTLIDEIGNTPIEGSVHPSALLHLPKWIADRAARFGLGPIIELAYEFWQAFGLPEYIDPQELITDFEMSSRYICAIYPIAVSTEEKVDFNERTSNEDLLYTEVITPPPPFSYELPEDLDIFLNNTEVDGHRATTIFVNQGSFEFQDQETFLDTLEAVRQALLKKGIYAKFVVNATTSILASYGQEMNDRYFYLLHDHSLMGPLIFDQRLDIFLSTFGAGTSRLSEFADGREIIGVAKVQDQDKNIKAISARRKSSELSPVITLDVWEVSSVTNSIESAVKRIQKKRPLHQTRGDYLNLRGKMAQDAADAAIFILKGMARQSEFEGDEQKKELLESTLANIQGEFEP